MTGGKICVASGVTTNSIPTLLTSMHLNSFLIPTPFPVSYHFFFPITRKLGLNDLRYHRLKELATLGLE